jgi:hypothetical protein
MRDIETREAMSGRDQHRVSGRDSVCPEDHDPPLSWLVRWAPAGDGLAMMHTRNCLGEYHHLSRVTTSRPVVRSDQQPLAVVCGVSNGGCAGLRGEEKVRLGQERFSESLRASR